MDPGCRGVYLAKDKPVVEKVRGTERVDVSVRQAEDGQVRSPYRGGVVVEGMPCFG